MIDHTDRENALDIVWGVIHQNNDIWKRTFPDDLGTTRREISKITGWSNSNVNRLVTILRKEGTIAVRWYSWHQNIWDAHYVIVEQKDGKHDLNC